MSEKEWFASDVKIYDAELSKELNTSSGIVWKFLEAKGKKAVIAAKLQVGVKTGALRQSIHMKHLSNASGQYLWIGSMKNYALLHHTGTRPHIIAPKNPNGKLVFTPRGGTRVIAVRQVRHPGTKPNPYLSNQLRHFLD